MHSELPVPHQPPSRWLQRFGLQALASVALGLVLACGGGGGGGSSAPAAPTITAFTVDHAYLTDGDVTTDITLHAVFANGTGVVDQGVGDVTSGTDVILDTPPVANTTYTLTVTNSAGTAVTRTASVTFVPAPTTPTITPTTDVTALSTGNVAEVAAQDGCTYAWTITNGTPTTATTRSITFTAGASGTVNLSCIVTNAAGLPSTAGTADRTIVASVGSTLAVTITGVTTADVDLTGTGVNQTLTATTNVDCSGFANGTYTLTANDVTEGVVHYPYLRTQTVTVASGVPTPNAVTVRYPAPTLTVAIPDVTAAPGVTVPMDFVLIPPGSFQMGAAADTLDSNWLDATPQHTVTIPHAFYMAKYECTQAQWMAVTGSNPSYFSIIGTGAAVDDFQRPVDRVDWNRIRDEYLPGAPTGFSYLEALNAAVPDKGFRLPSEAEFEYAVRAGTTDNYFFGNVLGDLSTYAWYNQLDADGTHPVGQKLPNPWGLYDILGNVWEWCEDDAHGTDHSLVTPTPPTTDDSGYAGVPVLTLTTGSAWVDSPTRAATRILRGGGWSGDDTNSPRSAFRYNRAFDYREKNMGFRLVMPVPVP